MCTLALYSRRFEDYPLVLAANRDEQFSRPSAAPALGPGAAKILAGRDLVAGGTWLGVNARGVAAAVVNRRAKIEQAAGEFRSRGLLCLDMLKAGGAAEARERLGREDGSKYQPFILLVASASAAFAAFNPGEEIKLIELDAGLHVFSNTSFTDQGRGKLDRARGLFASVEESLREQLGGRAALEPAVGTLQAVLGDHAPADNSSELRDAICVHTPGAAYGTASSSIIFASRAEKKFYFYHAPGAPCRTGYAPAEPLSIS
ncbi:MAG TPA: NRDE family protein [Candidatus Binatia bacterium]